jgi:TatD DNase family protein
MLADELRSRIAARCRGALVPARRRAASTSARRRANAGAAVEPRALPRYVGLFDVDANLTHKAFKGDWREQVVHAAAAGVTHALVPGSSLADSRRALALSQDGGGAEVRMWTTAGVHPFNAAEVGGVDGAMAELRALLGSSERIVALGECGLDYSDGFPPAAAQLVWFERQLDLACELQKPLFLHIRAAFPDARRLLDGRAAELPPVLVHCFDGDAEELQWCLSSGFHVSVSGLVCKAQRGAPLRALLPQIPLDALMVETDAPYLGWKGCRVGHAKGAKKTFPNVPSALPLVVDAVAAAMGRAGGDVAVATAANARRFFGV